MTRVPNKINHSRRAIQEGMLLTLDSAAGLWPKSTNTTHLSTDPRSLLFLGPQLSRGKLPLPLCCISATTALFWGSKGVWAWEGRKIFHNRVLMFPKEINLEHWGTSNPGQVFLEAQCGNQDYLFELSWSQNQMCFLVIGWWHGSTWVYHQNALSRKSPSKPAPPPTLCPYVLEEANILSISSPKMEQRPSHKPLRAFRKPRSLWITQEYAHQPKPTSKSPWDFIQGPRRGIQSVLLDISPKDARAGAAAAFLLPRNCSPPKDNIVQRLSSRHILWAHRTHCTWNPYPWTFQLCKWIVFLFT